MFYLWLMLSFLLQRPLLAGLVVLGIGLIADRAWVRWRSPFKWWQRRQSVERLRRQLDDAVPQGEALLSRAREANSNFRSGAIDLELGRGRLAARRYAEARDALLQAIEARPGSIEAHVLLARAYEGLGESTKANETKAKAWQLFGESPRFKRRQNRKWAWKAKPSAALRHYGILLAVVVAIALGLAMIPSQEEEIGDPIWANQPEEGWNVDTTDAPPATRFAIRPRSEGRTQPGAALVRSDLNRNGQNDLRRKLYTGDLWCRLLTHYPDLEDEAPKDFEIEDTHARRTFSLAVNGSIYYSEDLAMQELHESAVAFESLLESIPPNDCEGSVNHLTAKVRFGVEDGEPFHIMGSL